MQVIKIFLEVGVLWFLIALFTRSTDSNRSLREAVIVVFGMLFVRAATLLLQLRGSLPPLALIIEIAALYLLVDKVCGCSLKTTVKICGWYIGASIVFAIVGSLL